MRILALDFGEKTIGVSVSDPSLTIAQGVEIIRRDKENALKKSMARLKELVASYDVHKIVLGYPKNMNNTIGDRAIKTEAFKEKLEKAFKNVEIVLWDERLSTLGASRSLLEANLSRKKRKDVIDKMAAVFILQGYLECLKK